MGPGLPNFLRKGPEPSLDWRGGGGVAVVRDQTDPTAHALHSTLTRWRVQKGCAGRGVPMGIPMPRPQERTWGHFCPHQWAGHADKGSRSKGTGSQQSVNTLSQGLGWPPGGAPSLQDPRLPGLGSALLPWDLEEDGARAPVPTLLAGPCQVSGPFGSQFPQGLSQIVTTRHGSPCLT